MNYKPLLILYIFFLFCGNLFASNDCKILLEKIISKSNKSEVRILVGDEKLLMDYDIVVDINGMKIRNQCDGACYHETSHNMAEIILRKNRPELKEYNLSVFHSYLYLYQARLLKSNSVIPYKAIQYGAPDESLPIFSNKGLYFYKNYDENSYEEIDSAYKEIEKFIKSYDNKNKDISEKINNLVRTQIKNYEKKYGLPNHTLKGDEVFKYFTEHYHVLTYEKNFQNYQYYKQRLDESGNINELAYPIAMKEKIIESLKKGYPVGIGYLLNVNSDNPIYKLTGFKSFFPGFNGAHAVTIVGVKFTEDKKIESFLILDSAGILSRDKGLVHVTPSYFDKAVQSIFVID